MMWYRRLKHVLVLVLRGQVSALETATLVGSEHNFVWNWMPPIST